MNGARRIQIRNLHAEKTRGQNERVLRRLFSLRRAAAVAEFPGESERRAEEKGNQDAGERLAVNGVDAEFTVQEFRSGGLDGAGEEEQRSGGD